MKIAIIDFTNDTITLKKLSGDYVEAFSIDMLKKLEATKNYNLIFQGFPSAKRYASLIYAGELGSDFNWEHYTHLKNLEKKEENLSKSNYWEDVAIRKDMMTILDRRGMLDDKGRLLEPYADELYELWCNEMLLPYLKDYLELYGKEYNIESTRVVDNSGWYVNQHTKQLAYSTKCYNNPYKNIVDMIRAYQSTRFIKENDVAPLQEKRIQIIYTSSKSELDTIISILDDDDDSEVIKIEFDVSTKMYGITYKTSKEPYDYHALNRFFYGDDKDDEF